MRVKYLVEKFIDNDITTKELQELIQHLEDPEVRTYFLNSKQSEEIIQEGFKSLLRNKLIKEYRKIEKRIPFEQVESDVLKYGQEPKEKTEFSITQASNQSKSNNRTFNLWLPVAAAIVLSGLILFLTSHNRNSSERLYTEYYKKYDLNVLRGPQYFSDNLYLDAVNSYNTGNYKESIKFCEQLIGRDRSNINYRFLCALSLNESGLTEQAKQLYIPLIVESCDLNDRIYAVSTWNLSLIFLKTGKPDSAIYYLNRLGPSDNLFVDLDKSGQLLNTLNK